MCKEIVPRIVDTPCCNPFHYIYFHYFNFFLALCKKSKICMSVNSKKNGIDPKISISSGHGAIKGKLVFFFMFKTMPKSLFYKALNLIG